MMNDLTATPIAPQSPLAQPPLAGTLEPPSPDLGPERSLGLRTTHERQRQVRQKALGWN